MITALLIAYAVLFIHATTWEGQIFEKVGDYLQTRLPEWIQKPLYDCPICMSFWYGTAIQLLLHKNFGVELFLEVFAAAGINVINVVVIRYYKAVSDYIEDNNDEKQKGKTDTESDVQDFYS